MILGSLRRLVRARQPSQGLVEYGLIIAAGAIVRIAGLNAITQSQEGYWCAAAPTFASPTPSTGSFLHPTSVDQPSCLPSTPTKVGTAITCAATVHDIDSSAPDQNPPWGTLNFILNGSS